MNFQYNILVSVPSFMLSNLLLTVNREHILIKFHVHKHKSPKCSLIMFNLWRWFFESIFHRFSHYTQRYSKHIKSKNSRNSPTSKIAIALQNNTESGINVVHAMSRIYNIYKPVKCTMYMFPKNTNTWYPKYSELHVRTQYL